MLKTIRINKDITTKEMGDLLGVRRQMINTWERTGDKTSYVLTKYINKVPLSHVDLRMLKSLRRDNWDYDETLSPVTNDLKRIRNGLGLFGKDLSKLLGQYDGYWKQLEYHGRGLSPRDFASLDKHFNISSTTLRRHEIIVERSYENKPIPEVYKVTNSEIQEPYDLYDDQGGRPHPETYLPLLQEIERENGGSIQNASEEDPKLIRLRMMMGTKYYDKEGECLTW